MDIGTRLTQLRAQKGLTRPQAAKAMGVPYATYAGHENGTTPPPRDMLTKYARFYGVSVDHLVTGKGRPSVHRQIPIKGYVGAGAEIYAIDTHEPGDGWDYVDPPVDCSPDAGATIVQGTSMMPAYEDGDIIIYDDRSDDPQMMINRRCIAKLADGRIFVKRLRRGSVPGLYSLESFNAELIEDVAIEWVARIKAIMPR